MTLFKEAAVRAPRNGEILYHLGLAGQKLGQIDVARAAYERAARLPGSFPGKDQIAQRLAELPAPRLERLRRRRAIGSRSSRLFQRGSIGAASRSTWRAGQPGLP